MKRKIVYSELTDIDLAEISLSGDPGALEEIVKRYKDLVFNFTLRMVGDYSDAQDISQEVLIKIITKLSTFRMKSSLKTWILRITSNHVISQKRRVRELTFSDFSNHNELLDGLVDQVEDKGYNPELRILSDEMKNQCVEGMLLCLDRDQRSVFIIGAVMGIGSREGSQVLDITEDAYRKRLSRARTDLGQYMENRCGLINPENPCRCVRKARSALEAGYISDNEGVFNRNRLDDVSSFVLSFESIADNMINKISEVYRRVPVLEFSGIEINQLLQTTEFKSLIDFI